MCSGRSSSRFTFTFNYQHQHRPLKWNALEPISWPLIGWEWSRDRLLASHRSRVTNHSLTLVTLATWGRCPGRRRRSWCRCGRWSRSPRPRSPRCPRCSCSRAGKWTSPSSWKHVMIIALPPSLHFSPVKENWVKYGQQGLLHLPRLHRQLKDVRPGVHASVYNCKVSTKCFFLSFSIIFICLTLTAYCAQSETRFRLSRLSVVLYILHKEGTII